MDSRPETMPADAADELDRLRRLAREAERLRAAQEIAGVGSWELDVATGHLGWSSEVYRIFGTTPDQFDGTFEAFTTFLHHEDQPVMLAAQERTLAGGGDLDVIHRIVRADGTVAHVHERARLFPTMGARGPILAGTVQDVTREVEGIAALAASEARFRELAETIDDVFWTWDAVANRILYVSPNYERIFELPMAELYADPTAFTRGMHPEDLPRLQAAVASDPYTIHIDYRVVRADGTERWLEVRTFPVYASDGTVQRTVGIGRDITQLRTVTDRLRDSEERYRLLFARNPHAMWVYDVDTLRFLAVNATAVLRYGWTEVEFLGGMTILDIRPAEEVERLREHLRRGSSTGKAQSFWRHRTHDGQVLDVEVVSDEITWGGRAARLVLAHDVTERRKLEAQHLRAQRMESIGTLAGGIAHDLNHVLAPILMAIEMLRLDDRPAAEAEVLTTIERTARRGADLVQQILAFTRGVEGRRQPLLLATVIGEVVTLIRETFPRNIRLKVEIPEVPWPVLGDATQLHQVLLNLAVNARDAMPAGGTLTIGARNVIHGDEPDLPFAAHHGRHVALTVADTGTGIPAAVRDRIFDPFFTTKEIGKGTGLGLATVQAVVRNHGGYVNLYTEEGHGTAFRIYLPAPDMELPEPTTPRAVNLPRGNGELILVVDDEAAIRMITRQTLEAFGYRVLIAEHGAEAVAIYGQRGDEIALVLTDMMMPIMDGVATIRALRSINPSVRLIAASGLAANGNVARAAASGVADFLPKPYTVEELVRLVARLLAEAPER